MMRRHCLAPLVPTWRYKTIRLRAAAPGAPGPDSVSRARRAAARTPQPFDPGIGSTDMRHVVRALLRIVTAELVANINKVAGYHRRWPARPHSAAGGQRTHTPKAAIPLTLDRRRDTRSLSRSQCR